MKRVFQGALRSLAVLALLLAPALAQAQKPLAVISVSGVDNVLGDVQYLTQAAGAGDAGQLLMLMAGPYTAGIDKTRPIGAIVTMADPAAGGPAPVDVLAFVPVKDLNTVLSVLSEAVGEAEDAGDGVKMLSGGDSPVYIKDANGWAYLGMTKQAVMNPPAGDPTALLGGIEKEYDIAVRLNVQNIPAQYRQMAVEEMQKGFDAELQNNIVDGGGDRELADKLARNTLNSMKSLINESDTITIGWLVDASKQDVHLDFAFTAVPNTRLAEQFATLKDTKSDFSGFELPESAFTLNLSGVVSEEDKAQANAILNAVRTEAIKEIDNESDVPDKAAAKKVLGEAFDVLIDTLESGKIDGGAAVKLEPDSLAIIAGGYVSDGAKAKQVFDQLLDLAKQDPKTPDLNLQQSTHGGVELRTMNVPLPDDADADARKLLGDRVDVVVGTSGKAVYFGMGKGSLELLKQAIDNSATGAGNTVPPFKFIMALGPILEFAASMENNPVVAQAAAAAKDFKGRDRVSVVAQPIENGAVYRLKVDDGVFQLIGKAASMAGAGGGGGAAPF